jgi:outer membrane protein assembly factor BamB
VGSNNTDAVVWSLNGSTKVATVNIVYNVNGGAFENTIASGVDATAGKVNWNSVNDTMGNNIVVKVVDTANANAFGLSP